MAAPELQVISVSYYVFYVPNIVSIFVRSHANVRGWCGGRGGILGGSCLAEPKITFGRMYPPLRRAPKPPKGGVNPPPTSLSFLSSDEPGNQRSTTQRLPASGRAQARSRSPLHPSMLGRGLKGSGKGTPQLQHKCRVNSSSSQIKAICGVLGSLVHFGKQHCYTNNTGTFCQIHIMGDHISITPYTSHTHLP